MVNLRPVDGFPTARSGTGLQQELKQIVEDLKRKPEEVFQIGEDRMRSPDRYTPLRTMGVKIQIVQAGKAKKLADPSQTVTVYNVYAQWMGEDYVYTPQPRSKKTDKRESAPATNGDKGNGKEATVKEQTARHPRRDVPTATNPN